MCPTREFRSYYSVVTRAVTSTAEVSSMCRSRSPGQRRYAGAAAVWPGRLVLPVMSRSRNSADDCSCGKPPDSRNLLAYESGKRLPQRFDPVPSLAAPFFGRLRKALTARIEEHNVSADQDAMDGRRDLSAGGLAADPELGGLAADPELGGLAADPELGGLAADPELGGLDADPELGGLAADPTA